MRRVGQLMRHINDYGLAQRVQTLDLDDALSRPVAGTRLNASYQKLKNAESILILARSVDNAYDILYRVKKYQIFDEDALSAEFENDDPNGSSVSRVRNSLQNIGVLIKNDEVDGVWNIAQNNESNEFLDDVLKVLANTRSNLGDNIEINKILEGRFPDNEDDMKRSFKYIEMDLLDFIDKDRKQ